MKDELIILALLGVLISGGFGGGMLLGRKLGRESIMRLLPEQFDKLCFDCAVVGEKKGYKKGLSTCDDLLAAENQGRY